MAIKPENELYESDFVHEESPPGGFSSFVWMIGIFAVITIVWAGSNISFSFFNKEAEQKPLLQVTNRQMALFLWQNPEWMRSNVKNKTGYLPGFQPPPKMAPYSAEADEYVVAPPELLFHYHTWKRLVGDYVISRAIPSAEFVEFLTRDDEWLPHYWANAPKGYVEFISGMDQLDIEDYQNLPESVLPLQVKQAFWGWKNYMIEGKAINQMKPTVGEVQKFLLRYPNYARNLWSELYPGYLSFYEENKDDPSVVLPNEDIPPFLRVALYNYIKR